MAERCAIVGIGISDHKRVRDDLSMPGLLREAATRALADAEMEWSDIEAVVFGKAPDQFEGVMMPELFLSDAMGGAGKPMIRMHTAGSVGAHTAIFGAHLIESGLFESRAGRRLREAVRDEHAPASSAAAPEAAPAWPSPLDQRVHPAQRARLPTSGRWWR